MNVRIVLNYEHIRLEVPAEPMKQHSLSGNLHHLTAQLRLTRGVCWTEWRMDSDRISSGQSRRPTYLLHLCQLGVPNRRLYFPVFWPSIPGVCFPSASQIVYSEGSFVQTVHFALISSGP